MAKIKKIKLSAERLDEMAINYLGKSYEPGYVKERVAKNNYAPGWELTIQSYKAGVYGLLTEIRKNPELLKSILETINNPVRE